MQSCNTEKKSRLLTIHEWVAVCKFQSQQWNFWIKLLFFILFSFSVLLQLFFFKNIFVKTDRGVTEFLQISKVECFVTILSAWILLQSSQSYLFAEVLDKPVVNTRKCFASDEKKRYFRDTRNSNGGLFSIEYIGENFK